MTRTVSVIAVLALAATAVPAAAQDARGTVEQVGGSSRGPVPQISSGSKQLDAPVRSEPRTTRAAPQLTRERGTARSPGQQLYTGGRTAQPSDPLSRPSEGRTGAIARVEGKDRCDPAHEEAAGRTAACAQVIETRSAEFIPPAPTVLSPEQRLLVDQRLREGPTSARAAAKRLAQSGEDAESMQSQSVASVVLRTPPGDPGHKRPGDPTEGLSQETIAVINAIVGSGNPAPPNR